MPFTLSHVAVVLPLTTGRPGGPLVPAALVIGAMVPDLPYFVPPHRGSAWTHAAYGPVTVDLAAGLVLLAAWHFVLYRPLVDLAPVWLGRRLPPATPLRGARWGWAALSLVIGGYTHVILDGLTHAGRWGPRYLPVLNAQLGPRPAYTWLQFGLSGLGLLVLAAWAAVWLLRAEPRPVTTELAPGQRRAAWTTVAVIFIGSIGVIAVHGAQIGRPVEQIASRVATGSMSLTIAVAVCLCLVWQVDARLDGRSGQGPADGAEGGSGQWPGDQPIGGRQRRQ